jgi:hypothetical protein
MVAATIMAAGNATAEIQPEQDRRLKTQSPPSVSRGGRFCSRTIKAVAAAARLRDPGQPLRWTVDLS